MKDIKLAYGLREGKIVHIDELTDQEHGLACGCYCPACGIPLQAKLGLKNRHHFSHNSENCSSETAAQTALHMLAKEIIAQKGTMVFPAFRFNYTDSAYFSYEYVNSLPKYIELIPERNKKCDEVFLERKISSIVPDVVYVSQNKSCIIEIAVTHFVDDIKEQKIKVLGLPAIEIDISRYYGQNLNREEIEKEIIGNVKNRRWIYYPKSEELIRKAELQYKKTIDEIEHKKQEEKKEYIRQKEKLRIEREKYYCDKLKLYRSDIKVNDTIKNFHFHKEIKNFVIPFFLDIPIDGEIVFKCDRRIWQSAVFDKFIYYRNISNNAIVSINNIYQWIMKHQNLFKLDWYAFENELGDVYHVIKQYLKYMHFLGFVSDVYRQEADLLHSNTLTPPEQENANLLQSAVLTIEPFAQRPNMEIENYLEEAYGVLF